MKFFHLAVGKGEAVIKGQGVVLAIAVSVSVITGHIHPSSKKNFSP